MSKRDFELPSGVELSDEAKKGFDALTEFIKTELDEIAKGSITEKQLDEKMKGLLELCKESKAMSEKIESVMKEQGMEIKILKEGKGGHCGKRNLNDVCKELFTKENVDAILGNGSNKFTKNVTIKAADVIMTANAANAPFALSHEVVPGIDMQPVEPPAILQALNKGNTTSRAIYWINRKDKDGGSAFIDEGKLKPLMDWEYFQEVSTPKKIAVATKVTTEMLRDFAQADFTAEVRMMLSTDLYKVLDEKLLNGAGGTEPVGITTVASAFLNPGLTAAVRLPNNADAIRAAMDQMVNLQYKPDIVFMNPTDQTALALEKATDGTYINIQSANIITPLRVIPTTQIPQGDFLLMDSSKWIIRILDDVTLQFGWVDDDFLKNQITIIFEMSLHSYFNSIHVGAFIYQDYASIKALIEMP